MQRGKYVLTGAIVATDVRAAYLREVAGNKSHSVKQGDTLPDGYRVEIVEARKVVLRFNNDTEELEVQSSRPTRVAGSPGAPQGIVQPLSPYTTTIDRPVVAGTPGVPPVPGLLGVTPQPGIFPPGVPPQGVATGTPGFPVPAGVVPPPVPPTVPAAAVPAQPTTPGQPTDANPPLRRRMWQNAQ
jgi:hypothetical protein